MSAASVRIAREAQMVNETNVYAMINNGHFPGRWKRLHGLRGMPDYMVCVPAHVEARDGLTFNTRTFFVEVKEIDEKPESATKPFDLCLRHAQIPFFKDWPGEKYVLVRWQRTRELSWFSGKERKPCLRDEINGPFKRDF